jgi:hypothetical protein
VQPTKDVNNKPILIPIPPVTEVKTYAVDYLPLYQVPVTYVKAPRDKSDLWDSDWLEYDLDVQDTEFLRDVNSNGTQERLTWRQLEEMLWHLEVKNAEATQRSLQSTGVRLALRQAGSLLCASTQIVAIEQHFCRSIFCQCARCVTGAQK